MSDGEPGFTDGGEPLPDSGDPGLYSEIEGEELPPTEREHGHREPERGHEGAPGDEEMPIEDHIEEMIHRLGRVVIAMSVVAAIAFPFGDIIINFLWNNILPGTDVARPRVYHPLALMLARLKVSALAGFVASLPVFVYQTYLFMEPGLYPREKKYYLAAVPTSIVLATIGVSFAFYIVLPAIFTYFFQYSQAAANIAFSLTETFNLIVLLLGTFAFIFQIPLFIMLAIMMGLTTRRWLETRRIYFWGGFLTLAFLFSPDPTGMAPIIVAATMVALFEGTLLLLRWTSSGSLTPTLAGVTQARPLVYLFSLIGGYLISSAPVPQYYDQLPAVFVNMVGSSSILSPPLVIGGGIIAIYELISYLLLRARKYRLRWLFGHIRVPVWLMAVLIGYLGSPNPTLIQRANSVTLAPTETVLLVAGVIGLYEGILAVWRWRQPRQQ